VDKTTSIFIFWGEKVLNDGQTIKPDILVVILILLLLFCAPASLAAKKRMHRFNRAEQDCSVCHQDAKHVGVSGLFTKECAVCHSDTDAASHSAQFEREGSLEKLEKPQDPNAGMQMPKYYDESRIGEKPNPMVLVPAGEFVMGTNDRLPDEGPEHKVTLPAFYIDKYEVTNLQYKQFIDATNRKSPENFRNRTFPQGKVDHPVTYVSWYDANEYCEWAGKRLPSEQEWEKAARSTDARIYPWGNDFAISRANTPQRWTVLETEGDTTPVGAFPTGVSAYGTYDMSGNVWEWTASWYKPHPGNTRITENYGEKYKVLKGGSWWDCTFYKCGISAPSYNRSFFLQSTKNKSFGFRCAKDAN
jgi:formylglycine-generating enzyme required for sulfatase activity